MSPADPLIAVTCRPAGEGYLCTVRVGDDPGATDHEVTLSGADLAAFGGGTTQPETLVAASFAFLLEHEPRESILSRFALPVIGRYFPEYPAEIRRRIAKAG